MRRHLLIAVALSLAACTTWRDPREQRLPDGGVGVSDMGGGDGARLDAGPGVDCEGMRCGTGVCCVVPTSESCVPSVGACAGGVALECDSPDDCPAGAKVCCGEPDGVFRCETATGCMAGWPIACAGDPECSGFGGHCVTCPNAGHGHIDVCGSDVPTACPSVYALVSDGGTPDGGTPDGGTPAGCGGPDCHVQCGGSSCDTHSQVCCTSMTSGFCTTIVPPICSDSQLFCDGDDDCGSGMHCCFQPGTPARAACAGSCLAADSVVCTDASPCGGHPCMNCQVGMGVTLGLCEACPPGTTTLGVLGSLDGGTATGTVQCGAVPCSTGMHCCIDASRAIACRSSCPAGVASLACDGPEDCGGGTPDCCWDPATHAATCGTCMVPIGNRLCHLGADCGATSCMMGCSVATSTTVTAGFCSACPTPA